METNFLLVKTNRDLVHHGILGQRWGTKNGPPYPLKGGSYTQSEVEEIKKARTKSNSIYNKKHFDTVLEKEKTTLSTLSYDPNRTKDTDMFYAVSDKWDKDQYKALFNKKLEEPIYDENGNKLGTANGYKFQINNKIKSNIKVASEDSGAKAFINLYSNNRDFYNFVTDDNRMGTYFVNDKYKFKAYRDSRKILDKIQNDGYTPTRDDLKTIYRMFNYVIPSDVGGDSRGSKDVKVQRAKFFEELRKDGYGAVLDTNDALYGSYKAKSPVIVFDVEQIIPEDIKSTSASDKALASLSLATRKFLGI